MSEFIELPGLGSSFDQITKIAEGGMAEIYRARQIGLDRPVAIKRIRPELKSNPDIKKRFQREANASANLLHQNLAHVYDFIEFENESYIIMEYIDGFDASDIIAKAAPLPVDVALAIALKVLTGLHHVHSHGMIHRDLKPENIRITNRGDVKLMDFGIALDPGEKNLTMPGVLIGSPHYLAPEQILGSKLNNKVDLFAFGICFYEMLTGRRPFVETESETVFNRIQKGEYTPIKDLQKDMNPFIERSVQDCLQINPSKRVPSAKHIYDALYGFVAQNYSLAQEDKIRRFLMEKNFLRGDPSLINIVEKTTNHGFTLQAQRKKFFQKILIASIITIAVIFSALHFFQKNQKNKPTVIQVPSKDSIKK